MNREHHPSSRVLVHDRPLFGHRSGVGQYLAQLVQYWPGAPAPSLHGLLGGVRRVARDAGEGLGPFPRRLELTTLNRLTPRDDRTGTSGRSLSRRAYARALPLAARVRRRMADASLLFEPNHLPPETDAPVVTTVHDLSVIERPDTHPPDRVEAWTRQWNKSLSASSAFVCVSAATAHALRRVLPNPNTAVAAIPLASRWTTRPRGWSGPALREALGIESEFVVHVGTIEPRKNIERLLDALASLDEPHGPTLLLVGNPGWGSMTYWKSLVNHPSAQRVLVACNADDTQAAACICAANALVMPSKLEGFGLPVIEAMALGTPVIASTDPALTETAGGHAWHADAGDTDGWARRLSQAIAHDDQFTQHIASARRHAARRTWQDVAVEHARVFSDIAARR